MRPSRTPSIDAIWCIRGGYGSIRLLDRVDYAAMARRPKVLIGYSDITALLNAVTRLTGVVTFHGPVARASMPAFSRSHFERVLTRAERSGAPGPHSRAAHRTRAPGEPDRHPARRRCRGSGGRGEPHPAPVSDRHAYFPELAGAILFLEDVGEELYRVDRMLAHLRLIGALRRLAGVMVGRFTGLERSGGDGALGFDEVLETYLRAARHPGRLRLSHRAHR